MSVLLSESNQQQILTEINYLLHNIQMGEYDARCMRNAPHVIYPTTVTKDGDMYCCLYGEDLQVGIAGFGKTPKEACAEFDKAWVTEGGF